MTGPAFPYDDLPPERYWKTAVAERAREGPKPGVKFRIVRTSRIASAGSCFAVRVAEYLRAYGFAYIDAEPGGAALPHDLATRYGFRPLSARYGNIYTTLQLLQLFERAYGTFVPVEPAWPVPGGFVDPFRPRIQPAPFSSIEELETDRRAHLQAVRSMFETLDVFIFTLGLTEAWVCRADGAALPACPGRGLGTFDPQRYESMVLTATETIETLDRFVRELGRVNPSAKILLTVSPVPLVATMLPMHVARATALAKATLVAAAETIADRYVNVDYFASYELVMARGDDAFEADLRTVTKNSVERVMTLLFREYFGLDLAEMTPSETETDVEIKPCDEDELARLIELDLARRARES